MKDGSLVTGGIVSITYGMNEANRLNPSAPANNKYEAVITLSASGNSQSPSAYLPDGHYEIVAKTSLHDRAGTIGNALGHTGYTPNGVTFTRSFSVSLPTGTETRVNTTVAGNQVTAPPNSQATAADANGDYIVAWASDTAGAQGIYARLYRANWTTNASGNRVSAPIAGNDFLVTGNATASNASVAMDAVGDFVVTWSQLDAGTDWNVYSQRYNRRRPGVGQRGPSQRDDCRRPTLLGRGDGRRRRLHHRLAEHEPGRQRLRHLCPAL